MSNDIVDMKRLLFEYGEDWDIFEELVADYKQSYNKMLTAVEKAIVDGDFETLRLKSHTLKGIVANFYSDELKQAAFELECSGRNQDLSSVQEELEQFKRLNLQVLAFIDDYNRSKSKAS